MAGRYSARATYRYARRFLYFPANSFQIAFDFGS